MYVRYALVAWYLYLMVTQETLSMCSEKRFQIAPTVVDLTQWLKQIKLQILNIYNCKSISELLFNVIKKKSDKKDGEGKKILYLNIHGDI